MLNKSDVLDELIKQLTDKLFNLKGSLLSLIESRNSDTKSSSGDKFETGREMVQIEISKVDKEIVKTKQLIKDIESKYSQLIITDKRVFLISIPFGKLMVNKSEVFCISNSAPIITQLVNTKISENFEYRGVMYNVLDIT